MKDFTLSTYKQLLQELKKTIINSLQFKNTLRLLPFTAP